MDLLTSVTDYLRQHWQTCRMNRMEKEADIKFYETLHDPYGPVFAAKLRRNLHKELEAA